MYPTQKKNIARMHKIDNYTPTKSCSWNIYQLRYAGYTLVLYSLQYNPGLQGQTLCHIHLRKCDTRSNT